MPMAALVWERPMATVVDRGRGGRTQKRHQDTTGSKGEAGRQAYRTTRSDSNPGVSRDQPGALGAEFMANAADVAAREALQPALAVSGPTMRCPIPTRTAGPR